MPTLSSPDNDPMRWVVDGNGSPLYYTQHHPHGGALLVDPDTTAHYPKGDIAASPSVRHYYATASVMPFQRVHVHKEEEMGRRLPSSTDAFVDSRRVWGPKDEPHHHQGVYRAWWQ
jgi:hypothetical protein